MRILGIDPSTSCVGWALYDSERERLLGHGRIRPVRRDLGDATANADDRCRQIAAALVDLIPHECDLDLVASEKQISQRNAGDAPLHVVAYLVRARCAAVEVVCVEIAHASAYKAVCGRGNAGKPEVKRLLSLRFGEFLTEDEADALAVAIAADRIAQSVA